MRVTRAGTHLNTGQQDPLFSSDINPVYNHFSRCLYDFVTLQNQEAQGCMHLLQRFTKVVGDSSSKEFQKAFDQLQQDFPDLVQDPFDTATQDLILRDLDHLQKNKPNLQPNDTKTVTVGFFHDLRGVVKEDGLPTVAYVAPQVAALSDMVTNIEYSMKILSVEGALLTENPQHVLEEIDAVLRPIGY